MDEQQRMAQVLASHRKVIHRVVIKITIYYAILTAIVALAVFINPAIVDELPLGGVGSALVLSVVRAGHRRRRLQPGAAAGAQRVQVRATLPALRRRAAVPDAILPVVWPRAGVAL